MEQVIQFITDSPTYIKVLSGIPLGLAFLIGYQKFVESKWPTDIPYLGTNRLLIGSFTTQFTKESNPFIYMCKVQKEQGFPAIMKAHFGILQWFRYTVMLLDGELIQSFFSSQADSFPKEPSLYGPFETFIGKGILTSQGEVWKHHRTLMNNGFKKHRLDSLIPKMNELVSILLDKWSTKKTNIDVDMDLCSLTLEIIVYSVFGRPAGILNKDSPIDSKGIGKALLTILEEVFWRMIDPLKSLITPYSKGYLDSKNYFESFIRGMIEDARKNDPGEEFVVHYLLDPEAGLSTKEILDEVSVLIFAGHDTTAHTMSWFIYEMTQNPECYEKVYKEIHEVVGEGETNSNHVGKLKYIEECWKETLRLYPAAPGGTSRKSTSDFKIGNWTFPKGTILTIPAYMIHRSPKNYENPDKFDPDRWSDSRKSAINLWTFMSFSKGSRNCLGQPLANLESKIVLSQLLKNHKFKLSQRTKVETQLAVTLRPNGLLVDIEKLN